MKLQFTDQKEAEHRRYFFGDVLRMDHEGLRVKTLNNEAYVPYAGVIALWESDCVYTQYHSSLEEFEDVLDIETMTHEDYAATFRDFVAHRRNIYGMKIRINPKKEVEIRK
jgi:hypothetical protein